MSEAGTPTKSEAAKAVANATDNLCTSAIFNKMNKDHMLSHLSRFGAPEEIRSRTIPQLLSVHKSRLEGIAWKTIFPTAVEKLFFTSNPMLQSSSAPVILNSLQVDVYAWKERFGSQI